ncbi:hypothetical protein LEMLEM_LOCUS1769 [Lemmus lemmus]
MLRPAYSHPLKDHNPYTHPMLQQCCTASQVGRPRLGIQRTQKRTFLAGTSQWV